jgi:type II secretory pathway component PulL
MERVAAVVESEDACRVDLLNCRKQPPTMIEQGWSDWQLAAWVVGAIVVGAAVGVAGYAIAAEVGD